MADTVWVNLKKDWFDGQSLHQVIGNPHEFPSEYADKPKQAEGETDADWKLREKAQPFALLPSSAKVVEGVKTVIVLDAKGKESPNQTVVATMKK